MPIMPSRFRVLPAFLTLLSSYPFACCLADQEYIPCECIPCVPGAYTQGEYTQEEAYYTQTEVCPTCPTCPSTYDACLHSRCCADAPTDGPSNTCWGHASFNVDFLYWLFPAGPREIAVFHVPTAAISTTGLNFLGDYEKHFISTTYKPGVRLGATYALCCSDWAFSALYTDFHATFSNHFCSNGNTSIVPTRWPEVFSEQFIVAPTSFNKARSRFHLTYQTLDICLQYSPACLQTCCQTWEPYLGVRLLELDQRWKVRYDLNSTSSAEDFALATQWKAKLPAIGATFGVKGNYQLCYGLSVIGRLGASCVQGKVKEHARYEALSTSPTSLEIYKLHDHFRDIFTGWEGAIGLAFSRECPGFPCCTTALSIGYEVQSWWNMPTHAHDSLLLPGNSGSSNLNFTLHGLFIRGSVYF